MRFNHEAYEEAAGALHALSWVFLLWWLIPVRLITGELYDVWLLAVVFCVLTAPLMAPPPEDWSPS